MRDGAAVDGFLHIRRARSGAVLVPVLFVSSPLPLLVRAAVLVRGRRCDAVLATCVLDSDSGRCVRAACRGSGPEAIRGAGRAPGPVAYRRGKVLSWKPGGACCPPILLWARAAGLDRLNDLRRPRLSYRQCPPAANVTADLIAYIAQSSVAETSASPAAVPMAASIAATLDYVACHLPPDRRRPVVGRKPDRR